LYFAEDGKEQIGSFVCCLEGYQKKEDEIIAKNGEKKD
jgi:hypothetical protein